MFHAASSYYHQIDADVSLGVGYISPLSEGTCTAVGRPIEHLLLIFDA